MTTQTLRLSVRLGHESWTTRVELDGVGFLPTSKVAIVSDPNKREGFGSELVLHIPLEFVNLHEIAAKGEEAAR